MKHPIPRNSVIALAFCLMTTTPRCTTPGCTAAENAPSVRPLEAVQPVDFAREVLPVLSNKCFICHGPDSHEKDVLRLDSPELATADRGGYRAIDQQAPAKSAVLKRIHSTDDQMPPTDAEKQLTPGERDLLTRWIQQGG